MRPWPYILYIQLHAVDCSETIYTCALSMSVWFQWLAESLLIGWTAHHVLIWMKSSNLWTWHPIVTDWTSSKADVWVFHIVVIVDVTGIWLNQKISCWSQHCWTKAWFSGAKLCHPSKAGIPPQTIFAGTQAAVALVWSKSFVKIEMMALWNVFWGAMTQL